MKKFFVILVLFLVLPLPLLAGDRLDYSTNMRCEVDTSVQAFCHEISSDGKCMKFNGHYYGKTINGRWHSTRVTSFCVEYSTDGPCLEYKGYKATCEEGDRSYGVTVDYGSSIGKKLMTMKLYSVGNLEFRLDIDYGNQSHDPYIDFIESQNCRPANRHELEAFADIGANVQYEGRVCAIIDSQSALVLEGFPDYTSAILSTESCVFLPGNISRPYLLTVCK